MRRILTWIAAGLVAVVISAGLYFYIYGNDLVKEAVLRHGPQVTGSAVALDSVRLSPLSGDGRLSGFRVANPQGFSDHSALEFDSIAIALEPSSLLEDTVLIENLTIEAPRILIEPRRGGTNLQVLQDNIQQFAAQFGDPPPDQKRKNIIIRKLVMSQPQIQFSGQNLGIGDQSLMLADIELIDIGVGEDGVPPSEAARLAMDALMPQIAKALASEKGKKLLGALLGGEGEDAQSLEEKAKKALGKQLDKGLNTILGGKK